MYCGFYEEGDKCPECSNGKFKYVREGSCTCHISPPCSSCVNQIIVCTLFLNILWLPYAIIYWIYELIHLLFTVGRRK